LIAVSKIKYFRVEGSLADGNYIIITTTQLINNMLSINSPIGRRRRVCISAAWIVSLAVLSFLSLQLVEGFGCRSNFIGISSNTGTARQQTQLYNLPGQVSKKVIVTGAGKFCLCLYHMFVAIQCM